jgi:YaiO family outer membrane protein
MRKSIIIVFLLTCSLLSIAQPNARYEQAREHAYAGRYQAADQLLRQILADEPEHYDALFMQAMVMAWSGEYMPALRQLNMLGSKYPLSGEVAEAISRINYWAGEYAKALVAADKGLALFPENLALRYLKAQALAELEHYDEAISSLQDMLQLDPENQEAQALIKKLEFLRRKNAVGLEYAHARFSNTFSPWNQFSAYYKRKLPSLLLAGRLQYASMFDQQGIQAEVDAYPEINEKTYAYLNAGVSNATIFPAARWGAELYRELPDQWEASAGMRGLYFEEAPVHIYTAQLGHYFPAYWISARGFLTRLQGQQHLTGLLTARRFLQNEDHFLSLYLGNGATPLRVSSLVEIQRLDARWVGLDYQHPLNNRQWIIRSAVEYQHEAYPEIRTTDRLTFTLQVEKRF